MDIEQLIQRELDRRAAEKQALCSHKFSATIWPDGRLLCDQCDKELDHENPDYGYEIDRGKGTSMAIANAGGSVI